MILVDTLSANLPVMKIRGRAPQFEIKFCVCQVDYDRSGPKLNVAIQF